MSSMMRILPRSFLFAVISPSVPGLAYDLTVDVRSSKPAFVLGEPVIVSATVVNRAAEAVTVIHHNAPTLHGTLSIVDLRFGGDDEHFKRWSDWLRPAIRTDPRLLPPGESITVDLVMLFNSKDGFFATEPGKYWIQGRIVAHDIGEVLSPPVPIEIREPSPSDKPAWDWLNAHKEEYGRLVQIPWEAKLSHEFLQEAGRRCETSQSTYSEYLGLFLSRAYREGPKKDAELSARFAEIAKDSASSEKIRAEADKILSRSEPKASP